METELKQTNYKPEFPVHCSKLQLAQALSISISTLQEMLNRKYFNDLQKLGYCKNSKIINRAVLIFFQDRLALVPEDFNQ